MPTPPPPRRRRPRTTCSDLHALYASPAAHRAALAAAVAAATRRRYAQGQREHGGRLWTKPGLLAHAEAEAVDAMVYLSTLRRQLEVARALLDRGDWRRARAILRGLLGPARA